VGSHGLAAARRYCAHMIWFLLLGLGLVLGLLRRPWWTVVVSPAASLGVGALSVANEPSNYDMPGFGYVVGGVLAVFAVATWLLGRGLAELAHRLRARRQLLAEPR
jgi:peptidoglycan/LPS O-acetylase OafA/YrhL